MQTQINCPQCGTSYAAEVHQIIDVGRQPELKQMLLSGQLNVAQCPSCGAAGQIASAMIYHDPAHELFMVYIPQELPMDQMQREAYVGQLTRAIMDSTPAEQRRAYMFQPQNVLSMQTFMENVLETEGITKEMIARQKKQAELLNTLINADTDVQDYLIKERIGEIDDTFFAMLKSYVEQAGQMNDDASLIKMVNLQAKLMTETAVGREVEKRNIAMHAFSRDAKAEGLSSAVLLRHVLKNQNDPQTVMTIIQAGIQAMDYEFFSGLTAEIDKQNMAGDQEAVARLSTLRDELLKVQSDMQQQSQKMLDTAKQTLETILAADNLETAVAANSSQIDDTFMYVLQAEMGHAEQTNNLVRFQALNRIQEFLMQQIESQSPPEIQLINQLVRAETVDEQNRILDENQQMVNEDLLKIIDLLQEQVKSSGQPELSVRVGELKALVRARI